jgi:hypothetical protein
MPMSPTRRCEHSGTLTRNVCATHRKNAPRIGVGVIFGRALEAVAILLDRLVLRADSSRLGSPSPSDFPRRFWFHFRPQSLALSKIWSCHWSGGRIVPPAKVGEYRSRARGLALPNQPGRFLVLLLALLQRGPTGRNSKRACNSMSKPRRGFTGLGPAPSGFCCALCHRGDAELQIAMPHSCIGLWHRDCAEEFFGAPVVETKPKVAAALDREIVNERN